MHTHTPKSKINELCKSFEINKVLVPERIKNNLDALKLLQTDNSQQAAEARNLTEDCNLQKLPSCISLLKH